MWVLGDSKSTTTQPNSWPGDLTASLTPGTWDLFDAAVAGSTLANYAANLRSNGVMISASKPAPTYVLINFGVNDITSGLPDHSAWVSDYEYVIDSIRAVYADAQFYLMRPWKRGFDASSDTLATWVSEVVAARTSFVTAGPDERAWLKGSDNGTTNTTDGIHYSAAGEAACLSQWHTALGH